MPLPLNPTLRAALTGADHPLVGCWLSSASPLVAELISLTGFEWLLIDAEHSPNNLADTQAQLRAVEASGVPTAVRLPYNDEVLIKQFLDLGARTIIVPMVDTAEEAALAARNASYPPHGVRGVGSALARVARWGMVPNYLADASDHVSTFVQIESEEAAKNAAEIVATPGIDGIFIGPSDMAASMGHLGQGSHPDVVANVETAIDAALEAGVFVGVNAFGAADAERYMQRGVHFVGATADVSLLVSGAKAKVDQYLGFAGGRDTATGTVDGY